MEYVLKRDNQVKRTTSEEKAEALKAKGFKLVSGPKDGKDDKKDGGGGA